MSFQAINGGSSSDKVRYRDKIPASYTVLGTPLSNHRLIF